MDSVIKKILEDTGLNTCPPFFRDTMFIAALAVAALVWGILWISVMPTFSIENRSIAVILFLTIVWYPVLEEVLFRGVIQGSLIRKQFAQQKIMRLTVANWITSILFALAHLWYQPAIWAIVIIIPSLVYGFFRDRYSNIYPCIILHAFYNTGFTVMNVLKQW
ncbi:JDVT-CTERM system glutamic-type intramembrane protease MrtJ [Kaarinaea lacus]